MASGAEYHTTLNDRGTGGAYALPCTTRPRAAGVRLMSAASCDSEVVKLAQSTHECLFGRPLFVTDGAALLQYHQEYHCLPCLAQCQIQSDPIWASFGTHHCYHRLDELFPLVLVCQVPF